MKKTVFLNVILLFMLGLGPGISQETIIKDEIELLRPEASFDFWVGSWEGTWDEGEGKTGRGTNEVIKILDGTVVQENFKITKGSGKGFEGTSISVYQPKLKKWKQAWADSQGGYYDFTGRFYGGERIFQADKIVKEDGGLLLLRMVFKDIESDSFIWDWESSADDGKNWKLQWRIHYRRVKHTGSTE